jgi:hypothetical protein
MDPISTRSGLSKFSMAVPSERNSGFDIMSKVAPEFEFARS